MSVHVCCLCLCACVFVCTKSLVHMHGAQRGPYSECPLAKNSLQLMKVLLTESGFEVF